MYSSLLLCSLLLGQAPSAAAIDAHVREAMTQWQIPGMAVVVVHEDRVVYLKGFGVRELNKPEAVTPDTVFPIASCSKSFTALALAMLVDEGKASWDDPVRKHVPFFKLKDPSADATVTLRDLVCHRTGLGLHDYLWYRSGVGLEQRIRRLAHLEQDFPIRSRFQYQTVAFAAAGYAAGLIEKSSWSDVVRSRIFRPLDMKATTATCADSAKEQASAHRKNAAGYVEVVPRYPQDEDPAGSIHTTARDLARYLRFQLGDGTWQGRRLLSRAALAEPHTAQMLIRSDDFTRRMNPESLLVAYGMGWIVQDYRGKLLIQHGGAIDGFRAHLTLAPSLRLGIGILNNLEGNFANLPLSNAIVDAYLAAPPRDWQMYYFEIVEESLKERQRRHADFEKGRRPKELPSSPLTEFAGTYVDPAYGAVDVAFDGSRLSWKWGEWRGTLEHYAGDQFVAVAPPLRDQIMSFHVGPTARMEFLGRSFVRR
jgi:CubicO group peptidase (beta-lactamase class C family)